MLNHEWIISEKLAAQISSQQMVVDEQADKEVDKEADKEADKELDKELDKEVEMLNCEKCRMMAAAHIFTCSYLVVSHHVLLSSTTHIGHVAKLPQTSSKLFILTAKPQPGGVF